MVEDGSLRILEILSHAAAVIAEGEVAQLVTANDTATSEAAYLEVIEAKTAALFAAASRIGAVLAERPPAETMCPASCGISATGLCMRATMSRLTRSRSAPSRANSGSSDGCAGCGGRSIAGSGATMSPMLARCAGARCGRGGVA